jgi:D-serine dehydratase
MMDLTEIETSVVDDRWKGMPPGIAPFRLGEIGGFGWNLLKGDLPLPAAVLKDTALAHNGAWMRRFLGLSGAVIAPHGKTTMSPQLFARQLDDGAWGITLGTLHQVAVARRYGVPRILLANQIVDDGALAWLLGEISRDPAFDFYCLVDTLAGVRLLAEAARRHPAGRPLQALVEGGYRGGRTGCRTLGEALAVAAAAKAASPLLTLRGVEGFEGIPPGATGAEREAHVDAFLRFLLDIARACDAEGLFAPGPVILSAGGSTYYDMVADLLGGAALNRETLLVLRSGCYLTHDSGVYRVAFRRLLERTPEAQSLGTGLQAALEVWAQVQSRPEPTRAILSLGKRDASYDSGFPAPLWWQRPGETGGPQPIGDGHKVVAMNDQHAYLDLPEASPLAVGDGVGLGISHPCLTFDKWQILPVVDDSYTVRGAVRTFF